MIDTFSPPEPKPVALSQIDGALRALWAGIEPQEAPVVFSGLNATMPSVTRAVALNLIVYAPGAEAVARATEAARQLTMGHPCRTLVLNVEHPFTHDPSPDAPLATVEVLAHCQPRHPGEPRICAEQLTLHLRGAVVPHLDKVVLPLLVPDLRTVLWWMGNVPFDADFYRPLSQLVDQMIVEGSTYDDPEHFLIHLAQMVAAGDGPEVRGLGWARLTQWRRLIAQFFDGERNRPYLDRIDRVLIRHHGTDSNPDRVEPLLLVGWLASRLGWTPAGADGDNFHLTIGDRHIEVVIEPHPEPGPHGLLSVELFAGSERSFRVERWQNNSCMRTVVEGANIPPVERVTTADERSPADLIGEELEILPRDTGLETALALIPALVGA